MFGIESIPSKKKLHRRASETCARLRVPGFGVWEFQASFPTAKCASRHRSDGGFAEFNRVPVGTAIWEVYQAFADKFSAGGYGDC